MVNSSLVLLSLVKFLIWTGNSTPGEMLAIIIFYWSGNRHCYNSNSEGNYRCFIFQQKKNNLDIMQISHCKNLIWGQKFLRKQHQKEQPRVIFFQSSSISTIAWCLHSYGHSQVFTFITNSGNNILHLLSYRIGIPWWLSWWRISPQCKGPGFHPRVGKFPWRRAGQLNPVFSPGESPWSPWGHKEWLSHDWATFTFPLSSYRIVFHYIIFSIISCVMAFVLRP